MPMNRWWLTTHRLDQDKSEWINLAKKIFSNIDEVQEKLNLYNTQINNYYNELYQSAINIGSDFSKIINGKIPTKYTIKKDSKFCIFDSTHFEFERSVKVSSRTWFLRKRPLADPSGLTE